MRKLLVVFIAISNLAFAQYEINPQSATPTVDQSSEGFQIIEPVDLKTTQPLPMMMENFQLKNQIAQMELSIKQNESTIQQLKLTIRQLAFGIIGLFSDGKITGEELQNLYALCVRILSE